MFCIINGEVGVYQVEQEKKANKEKLTLVKKIKDSQCFGEQCLSTKSDQKWEYKCTSPECSLLTIQRRELKRLFSSIKKEEIMEKLKFLSSLSAFADYNSNLLLQIYSNSTEMKFYRNHSVFQEGEESNFVFIIKSGYFLVKSSLTDSQNKEKVADSKYQSTLDPSNSQVNKLLQKKKTLSKEQKIVIWGEKELFGEEDVLEDKLRRYSVICESTEGEIFRINKDFFISNIMQEESSRDVIQQNLSQKLKLFQQKSDNAVKQLYDSDLSKYYSQVTQKNTEQINIRQIPPSNIQAPDSNPQSSISNPKNISFKTLIKKKLIGHDSNINLSLLSSQKKENNSSFQTDQISPNINELINSSQVLSNGDQTNKHKSPNNVNTNTPPSRSRKLAHSGSQGQISSFSSYAQTIGQGSQPFSNKSLLDTVMRSTLQVSQKQEFENELKRLMIVQTSESYWLQNQIENVNQELIPKEQLIPPEPYCTDSKAMELTPQVKKFYNELKRNYFRKYEGKEKKTFNDFAKMKHIIKHRGILQLIEEDLARQRSSSPLKNGGISGSPSVSTERARKSPQNETESISDRIVQNIIKNKILKGNDARYNEFRSQSMDIANLFSKQSSLIHIQESYSSDDNQDKKETSFQPNLQWAHEKAAFATAKTSTLNSPGKKDLVINLQKRSSNYSVFPQSNRMHVSFLEDNTKVSKSSYKQEVFSQMKSMPDLEDRPSKAFSFTVQAQKSLLENNSPIDSIVFDTIEKQNSSQFKLDKQNSKPQSLTQNTLPSNKSLPTSPLKQRSQNNEITASPFNTNLKKKYYVLKQRNISPRKQYNQIQAQSLNTISIQQIKQDLQQIEQSNNSTVNTYKKNVNFTQQLDSQPGPIINKLDSEPIQIERLKPSIRSKSVIQQPSTPSTTTRSIRNIKIINRSQSPNINRAVKYLNFSEICSKFETTQSIENPPQKVQSERNSYSMNNLNSYNIKSNILRQSAQQYLGINNDQLKNFSPPQRRRISERGIVTQTKQIQTNQILSQCFQNHNLNMKQRNKDKQQKELIIEKDNSSSQKVQTEGGEDQICLEKNKHFSITNRFFDRLEKKRSQGDRTSRIIAQLSSSTNNTNIIQSNMNFHNNNNSTFQSSASVAAKIVLQKRVISNLGNSSLLNTIDLSKLKKAIV